MSATVPAMMRTIAEWLSLRAVGQPGSRHIW
jgi:hypothetical protein